MTSKHCVVLGGAGDVGEGIVRQLRAAGHDVAVPSRSTDKLVALEQTTLGKGRLLTRVGDIGQPERAGELAQAVRHELGPIDLVVAAIGGWWSGPPLVDMDLSDWHRLLESGLSAHLIAARAFLPLVTADGGGQYLFINGAAGQFPVAGSGPVSIASAGQEMMKSVLAAENSDESVRINALMLMTPVMTRSRTAGRAEWLTADDVGRHVLHLLDKPLTSGETEYLASRTAERRVTGGALRPLSAG